MSKQGHIIEAELSPNHVHMPVKIPPKMSAAQFMGFMKVKADIGIMPGKLCSYKGVEILEGHLMPDHTHMPVSIPPKMSVSSFMGYLKGKSALTMFDKHANLGTDIFGVGDIM